MKKTIDFLNLVKLDPNNNEELNKRNDMYRAVRREKDFDTIWAIHGVVDLNSRALEGEHNIYFMGRFNPADSKAETRNVTVNNPTWLDLWRVANALICEREEEYRTDLYIEKFEPDSDGDLELRYGS
ncbi:hypothetical protein LA345_23210 [Burkholderia vietnamiensis]|nr:hypothetical protein [Burkholderia vietnamiensis]